MPELDCLGVERFVVDNKTVASFLFDRKTSARVSAVPGAMMSAFSISSHSAFAMASRGSESLYGPLSRC